VTKQCTHCNRYIERKRFGDWVGRWSKTYGCPPSPDRFHHPMQDAEFPNNKDQETEK
jgi:hypothetical protein